MAGGKERRPGKAGPAMTSSLTILAVYAALLMAVLLTPYASLCMGPERLTGRLLCALLFSGALILTIARQDVPALGAFLLLPLAGLGAATLLGGVTAALLYATVIWWWSTFQVGTGPAIAFAALALAAGCLPRWKRLSAPSEREPHLLASMLACLLIGLCAGLITTPFESPDPLYTVWHHWSALLAPVEAWRGGGVPYRDFPIQYGLGPTTLLLASCGTDCWRGLFYTAVVANALYFATLAGCAIILTARAPLGVRWLALLALFCASFFWTGFPIQYAGPVITPAVAGLRFLTISALLFHILLSEQRQVRRDWIGHAIWLVDLFWSPEAAFFATVIWWPYLALRDATTAENGRAAFLAFARGAARGAIALVAGIGALVLVLWLLSDRRIMPADFFAYIQHPPGMRPIKPMGTIWLALTSIALALLVLARQGLSPAARSFYACLLGFVAAGIYYLSRSHDNNILNLFPLLVPVLLATLAGAERLPVPTQAFVRGFVHTALAAMVAFVATFNYAPWREGLAKAGLVAGPDRMLPPLAPARGDSAILSPDAVAALGYLRGRSAGAVMLFDERRVIPRSPGTAWTSVNNIANFEPLPGAMILDYIQRSAASYRRSGWIIVGPGFQPWADAFQTAYDVRERKSLGRYQLLYLTPRNMPANAQDVRRAALELDRHAPGTRDH